MKDKRNCNQAYPMYGMPMMVPPIPNAYQSTYDINSIEQRLNVLEDRINRLEKTISSNNTTNYNKYNDNYYMV